MRIFPCLLLLFGWFLSGCLITPDISGLPCDKDSDCIESKCVAGFCGGPKESSPSENNDAGENHTESTFTEGTPEGSCQDNQKQECYMGPANTAGVGLCKKGEMTCTNGKWSTCVGEVKPTTETCDDKDNDCDGKVDNGFATLGQGCEAGQGECRRTGKIVCKQDGSGVECGVQAGKPAGEVCDGKDNDCDGKINNLADLDKDCSEVTRTGACRAGKWTCENNKKVCKQAVGKSDEMCDGKDNDCDGQVDNLNDLGQDCKDTVRQGICQSGKWACESNKKVCKQTEQSTTEICDLKDNDCNGKVDDITSKDCDVTGKLGECKKGKEKCDSQGKLLCEQLTQPGAKQCNGKDNDCDGKIDEGMTRFVYTGTAGCVKKSDGSYDCKGTCGAGVETCQAGKWNNTQKEVVPATESCNSKDDNCDGLVDENVARCVITVAGSGAPTTNATNDKPFGVPGKVSFVSAQDGPALQTHLYNPNRMVWDEANQILYVAEILSHRIRKISFLTAGTCGAQSNFTGACAVTIAGNGIVGSLDSVGTKAQFNQPTGLALDGKGNLYITDTGNQLIRKLELQSGKVTTIAGRLKTLGQTDGSALQALFLRPTDLLWVNGKLYVSDTENHRIREISFSTVGDSVRTLAGGAQGFKDGKGTAAQFLRPNGLAWDGTHLLVVDSSNHSIRKVKISDGEVTTFLGDGTRGSQGQESLNGTKAQARIDFPTGIVWRGGPNKIFYVTGYRSSKVRQIAEVTSSNCGNQSNYTGLCISTVAGVLRPPAVRGYQEGAASQSLFRYLGGIVWSDKRQELFVSDTVNNRVRKVSGLGGISIVSTLAGRGSPGLQDGPGAQSLFHFTAGLLYSSKKKCLYIADKDNSRIRKLDLATQQVSTVAGSDVGGSLDGVGDKSSFLTPLSITLDSQENLYVVGGDERRIRKVSFLTAGTCGTQSNHTGSCVTTIAGNGIRGTTDGPANLARFVYVSVIASHQDILYVGDNLSLRKVEEFKTAKTCGTQTSHTGWCVSTLKLTFAAGTQTNLQISGMVFDSKGDLYVTSITTSAIYKITFLTSGTCGTQQNISGPCVTLIAGSLTQKGTTDGPGSQATFNAPIGLAIDSKGSLFITDYDNHRVRQITFVTNATCGSQQNYTGPCVTTVTGDPTKGLAGTRGLVDGPTRDARFERPAGIVLDSQGYLYISDSENHRIRRMRP